MFESWWHTGAGLIYTEEDEPRYLFEKKTHAFPRKNFVGTLFFYGGNWTDYEDNSPASTWERELKEEFQSDQELINEILKNPKEFHDYYLEYPESVSGGGDVKCVTSIFFAMIRADYVRAHPEKFLHDNPQIKTPPSEPVIRTIKQLHEERLRFGSGYDRIFIDFISEKFGYKPDIEVVNGITVVRLDTSPSLSYSKRDTRSYKVNPRLQGRLSDESVFI